MQRVHSIDYLRGLMALSVLFYHFAGWSVGVPDSSTLLGRLGIYAVSIFFIISGMSLYIAYQDQDWNRDELVFFIKKRYLRLIPAFWAGCFLSISLFFLTIGNRPIHWETLFVNLSLNLSLTFGFLDPGNYLTVGGWSIGNEVVFYAIFPLIMWQAKNRSRSIKLALLISASAFLFYALYKLSTDTTLASQWKTYINPLNNAFLFILGISIAWTSKNIQHKIPQSGLIAILALSTLLFWVYPAEGNQISIVTGIDRVLFTAFCGALCFSVLNMRLNLGHTVTPLFKILGDISYTIYMFHGALGQFTLQLIAPALDMTSQEEKYRLLMYFTAPITLIASYFFYTFVEKPIMKFGRQRAAIPQTI